MQPAGAGGVMPLPVSQPMPKCGYLFHPGGDDCEVVMPYWYWMLGSWIEALGGLSCLAPRNSKSLDNR